MYQLLKPADVLKGQASGATYSVGRYIGGGGQGEVYEAVRDGSSVAIKWYFAEMATPQQRRVLESLVAMKSPDHRFLWPLEVVAKESANVSDSSFGYAMPLRESRFRGIVELLKATVQPSFATLTTAALNLVEAFKQLHAKGRSYRDINEGGVFVDFANGDVLVCDNDNVFIDGLGDAGVKGKMRWMAPEIVVGKACPSADTDLYSLSVLLFYMFIVHHPLEGKRESDIRAFDHLASVRLYGEAPLFIYDPDDDSNRPVMPWHKNAIVMWRNYPRFFQRLFMAAFTVGLRDTAHGRVRLSDWRKGLVQLRDSIYHCTQCKAEVFFDAERFSERGGAMEPCIECGRASAAPIRMRFDAAGAAVVVEVGKKLFDHHLYSQREYVFGEPRAEFLKCAKSSTGVCIRNLSEETWTISAANGAVRELVSGMDAPVDSDIRVNAGHRQLVFRV